MIYLIQKAWSDPMENHDPWGYATIGAVPDKQSAERIVASAKELPEDFCWGSAWKGEKDLRYVEVEELSFDDEDAIISGECKWECHQVSKTQWGTFVVFGSRKGMRKR